MHAERSYLPGIELLGRHNRIALVGAIELPHRVSAAAAVLEKWLSPTPVVAVDPNVERGTLFALLDDLLDRLRFNSIILSTEPVAHLDYLRWAIDRKISCLVDKPPILSRDLAVRPSAAQALRQEWRELLGNYSDARNLDGGFSVCVAAHRRFNPIFQRARSEVLHVLERTSMPVTSVIAEHGDGEWRLPRQAIHQSYHPYNEGYGAFGHSGYHVIDTALWMLAAGRHASWRPTVRARTAFLGVMDYLDGFPKATYTSVFGSDPALDAELAISADHTSALGEVDGHALISVQDGDRTAATIALHMQHNTYSTRTWASTEGRDLYQGNGRVTQESWVIHQGPFQTLRIASWQSGLPLEDMYAPGAPRDYTLSIFRNPQLVSASRPALETIKLESIEVLTTEPTSVGPGKEAILRAFFLEDASSVPGISDLADHRHSMEVLCAIYEDASSTH
jgi:predicted dehydrogenase